MVQVKIVEGSSVSSRLRNIRDRNGLTTQQMSEMTSVPKRSLESYMLKENAPLPGLEAVKKIAEGLGVSLDYLIFGSTVSGADIARLTRLSARAAVLDVLKKILSEHESDYDRLFQDGKIMGLSAEELAAEIAADAGARASELARKGVRRGTLETAERAFTHSLQNSETN